MITYREFAPAPELVGHVRAYFSFMPETRRRGHGNRPVLRDVRIARDEPFWTPTFADARTSLALHLGAACHAGTGWTHGTPLGARVIGAQRSVSDETGTARSEMVGAYFEHGAASAFLDVPVVELTDRVLSLEDIWGSATAPWVADIADVGEAERVAQLEARLFERLRPQPAPRSNVDVLGLARWVQSEPSSMSVSRLADAAGVSRRHLSRVFRQVVGLGPKQFCRLARFQVGLRYAGAGHGVNWASVAADLGYADQSHMIAEFRKLSGLTPEALATRRWFHPFILEARSRLGRQGRRGERPSPPNAES